MVFNSFSSDTSVSVELDRGQFAATLHDSSGPILSIASDDIELFKACVREGEGTINSQVDYDSWIVVDEAFLTFYNTGKVVDSVELAEPFDLIDYLEGQ